VLTTLDMLDVKALVEGRLERQSETSPVPSVRAGAVRGSRS
jgi:hypothetical protein